MLNKKIPRLNKRDLTGQSALIQRKYQRLFSVTAKFVLFVLLTVGVLGFGAQAQADDYYMATNGSDTTGDGSPGNEWQTLQHSMAQMSGGGYFNHKGWGLYKFIKYNLYY